MRIVCFDVGKRNDGPMALCDGQERGVTCASSWFAVTCPACLAMPLAEPQSAFRKVAHPDVVAYDREPEGPEIE